jgi:mannose-6-phosphate isomerase-like protein (cupin superfamily)
MSATKINLAEKFSRFQDHWTPRILAELNGQHVKAVKIRGTFDWHHHPNEDELFLVVHGRFRMEFRDQALEVGEGEHRPVAENECHILLVEPVSTLNTGNVRSGRTLDHLETL